MLNLFISDNVYNLLHYTLFNSKGELLVSTEKKKSDKLISQRLKKKITILEVVAGGFDAHI